MSIYYQPQQGGLCRMHALNAFFGYEEITARQFAAYLDEFDTDCEKKFGKNKVKSRDYDGVTSDGHNIVTYILAKYGYLTKIGVLPVDTIDKFVFVFNKDHIWGVRRQSGKLFNVDSISGVTPIGEMPKTGFYIRVISFTELVKDTSQQLANFVNGCKKIDHDEVARCVNSMYDSKLLNGIEVCMSQIIDSLARRVSASDTSIAATRIRDLAAVNKLFMLEWRGKKEVAVKYLPALIVRLCKILQITPLVSSNI